MTCADLKLFISSEMIKRLDFARMIIEVEPKGEHLAESILVYSIDRQNAIINHLLQVWRECKAAGLPLFKLKREQYVQIERYVYELRKNRKKEYSKVEAEALRVIEKVRRSAASYAVSLQQNAEVVN